MIPRPPPSPMSQRRLEWTLRARGPELATWPARDRQAAIALARTDPAACVLLAEALAAEAAPPQDPAAQCRIQLTIRQALTPLSRGIRWTAMAACLLAGLYFGLPAVETEITGLVPTIQATTPATMLAALDP